MTFMAIHFGKFVYSELRKSKKMSVFEPVLIFNYDKLIHYLVVS